MITAELKYRDYVPNLTIAIKFARLRFECDGELGYYLERAANLTRFYKYDIVEGKIEVVQEKIEENNQKMVNLSSLISEIKKQHKITLFNKVIRKKLKEHKIQIENLFVENQKLKRLLSELEHERWYETYELINRFRSLLLELGFVKTHSHSKESNLIDIDLYACNGNEEELLVKLKNIIAKLEREIETEKLKEKQSFSSLFESKTEDTQGFEQ